MRSRGRVVIVVAAVIVGSTGPSALAGDACAADLTGDNTVDGGDLGVMLGAWGPCIEGCFGCVPDLDDDCFVDGADLGALLGAWGPCAGGGFDIAIEHVSVTPTPILEGQTAAIAVDVSNSGDTDRIVILVVQAVGSTPNCAIQVPANGIETCTVAVVAPAVPTSCGQLSPFPVQACAIVDDDDDSNDCDGGTLLVEPAYADLVFQIVDAPAAAPPCGKIGWTVHVTNIGTAVSADVCFVTALDCAAGAGQYGCTSGTRTFSTGVVAPAQTKSFEVDGYVVPCDAGKGTHWIKVEFDAGNGCMEPCADGNYDEVPVAVGG